MSIEETLTAPQTHRMKTQQSRHNNYCLDCEAFLDDEGLCCYCLNDTLDIVNQPTHYARWAIEPITYIMRNGFEFWRGNIIKYASRAGFKLYGGKTKEESEVIDLEKVIRYSEMRINQIKGEEVL